MKASEPIALYPHTDPEPSGTNVEPIGNRTPVPIGSRYLSRENSPEPIAVSVLLEELSRQGIRVQLSHGTDLRVRAPKGILTEERKELIRAHKADLVRILTCHPCARCEWGLFPNPGTICFHCRRAMQHEGGEAA